MDKVLVRLHLALFDIKSHLRWISKDQGGGLDTDGLMSKINSLTGVISIEIIIQDSKHYDI